jgi:hypothetical protein
LLFESAQQSATISLFAIIDAMGFPPSDHFARRGTAPDSIASVNTRVCSDFSPKMVAILAVLASSGAKIRMKAVDRTNG